MFVIIGLKNKDTLERKSIDISCSELYVSPTGLWAEDSSADSPFIDILKINNVKRKENGEWVDYYIDTFSDGSIVYRYQKNRNIYNKRDVPNVVTVGEN